MARYPSYNCRELERRLKQIGCELVRTTGSHRHFSNPFRLDRLITYAYHVGDVPRGIIDDMIEDLGITREDFYFKKFPKR
ncbi:MAG TPA: type II toxin-antitoxin system HicA family toxin [Pyrinomonadaceae bacterium]|nr:type II toxin-antitoxin system HicA family toxin [Pyrinomonadaceae bacterium]